MATRVNKAACKPIFGRDLLDAASDNEAGMRVRLGYVEEADSVKATYLPFDIEFLHDVKPADWTGDFDLETFLRGQYCLWVR
jgi:hypothetical protein